MPSKKLMGFVAVCGYPNHSSFCFFSEEFYIENWADLESEGQKRVSEQWMKISPHPPPDIVNYLPGTMQYVPDERK